MCLDGNPVGEMGAKTLMLIPVCVGGRVALSVRSCNINIRSETSSVHASASRKGVARTIVLCHVDSDGGILTVYSGVIIYLCLY